MSDDFGIAGKTALVTGSGRNIGRAIVLELAGRGANVIVNARSDEAEADAVAKEAEGLGARSLVVMGEAADKATVERMRTQAEETFGGVDIYVSNAARRLYKNFFEISSRPPGTWPKRSCPACAIAAGAGWCISTGRTAGWAAGPGSPTRSARAACAP